MARESVSSAVNLFIAPRRGLKSPRARLGRIAVATNFSDSVSEPSSILPTSVWGSLRTAVALTR
jgi:hypothetical protein